MALVIKDRVKGTTQTTGTGTYTVDASTPTGMQHISVIGDGNTSYFTIEDGTNWECILGTVAVGGSTTVARTTILSSSNGGAAVNWGGGTRNIFVDFPASGLMLGGNNLSEIADAAAARTNLALGTAATKNYGTSAGNLVEMATGPKLPAVDASQLLEARVTVSAGQSGGTVGKVVRLSAANTWVDASQADTIDQLAVVAFKEAAALYVLSGRVALAGLTAAIPYYLSTAGAVTSVAPPVSGSVRRLTLGVALSTTEFLFRPSMPLGGV